MKIGILTHHYINNFGAFLQAYALQEAIKKQYPNDEVVIINYINAKHYVINTLGWFRFYKNKETFRAWKSKIKLPKTFKKARKSFLNLTPICFTANKINNLKFDTIVIGSDEVWNYEDKKSTAKVKFAHGLDCKNIITYAPSVGKSNTENNIPTYVSEGLHKFSAFSTRDELTSKLIKNIVCVDAVEVLDPTFLFSTPTVKQEKKKDYILFYYCDNLPKQYLDTIKAFAKSKNLAIYGAGECNKMYDDITVNLSPFEWVQMFREAKFVFTGTFHGTVFSILSKKNFACYLTNESRIKKVNSLLNDFEIENRIIQNEFNIEIFFENAINYNKVDDIISKKAEKSYDFLVSNIKTKD